MEGVLQGVQIAPGTPARYTLRLRPAEAPGTAETTVEPGAADAELNLGARLGEVLQLEWLGRASCLNCGATIARRYGGGYCYPCFTGLARCDLCIVSPVRCHFAQGTCREPAWGEAFCMQPHLVYLANSSGLKVGITRLGRETGRWLDQGACQALPVARAASRYLAGVVEAALGRWVSERTDWRLLLRGDATPLDLPALLASLRPRIALPSGVDWLDAEPVRQFDYPVCAYPRILARFDLERDGLVRGRLTGLKGQFLLFEHGTLNLGDHRGCHLRVTTVTDGPLDPLPEPAAASAGQMELFA